MTDQARGILEAALLLAPEERALLAEALLESLTDDQGDLTNEALLAELGRRRAEVDQPGTTVTWSVLRDES